MTNTLAVTLMQIMNVGSRPLMSLSQLDEQMSSQCFMQRLNASANNQKQDVRLKQAGAAPLPKDHTIRPKQRTIGNCLIADLGLTTRVITACKSDRFEFESFLQILSSKGWVTIVCYEFRNGRGRRKMYYANGQTRLLLVDLPQSVVLEMAQTDFQRNWTAYYEEFQKRTPDSRVSVAFPA